MTRLGRALAGAQIKRNVGPAPVVDEELHGDEGFGARIRRDHGLGTISRHAFIAYDTFAILSAHGASEHLFVGHGRNGLENLGLLVANDVGVEGNGRLHGGQRDELEDMVGHHVAQRSGLVVVTAALLHADGFGHGDLDMIDVAAVPDRLEDAVGEAKDQDVLDGLLAEVMVDAVDLLFVQDLPDLLVQVARRIIIVAEWFFDDDAPPAAGLR